MALSRPPVPAEACPMERRSCRRLRKRYVGSFQPQLPDLCEPDWHLDEDTRRLGRRGLTEARAALERCRSARGLARHGGRQTR